MTTVELEQVTDAPMTMDEIQEAVNLAYKRGVKHGKIYGRDEAYREMRESLERVNREYAIRCAPCDPVRGE